MEEHIQQAARDYALKVFGKTSDKPKGYSALITDFEAGIRAVLAHPEEFGLQEKQY